MEHVSPGHSPVLHLLLLILPTAILLIYLSGALRLCRRSHWPTWRMVSFSCGTLLIIIALLPPVAHWAHHDLRGHMAQHLLLGMFGPAGLVFGAPGTLLLRTAPARLSRRLMSMLNPRPVRLLIHPLTAAILDVGGMYLLYLTPLYGFSMRSPGLMGLVHLHFVLSGYLFTWSIAGPDPAPRRPGEHLRLAVLFFATAAHAILAKIMYAGAYPAGTGATLDDLHSAAEWMYYGGDLAELIIIFAFFAHYYKRRGIHPVGGNDRPAQTRQRWVHYLKR